MLPRDLNHEPLQLRQSAGCEESRGNFRKGQSLNEEYQPTHWPQALWGCKQFCGNTVRPVMCLQEGRLPRLVGLCSKTHAVKNKMLFRLTHISYLSKKSSTLTFIVTTKVSKLTSLSYLIQHKQMCCLAAIKS